MANRESVQETEPVAVEVSEQTQSRKREWATPAFEEFDYLLTQASILNVGTDGGLYS